MGWTKIKTWVGGSLVGVADLNTYLRDNLLLLKTDVSDAGRWRPGAKHFAYSSGQGNAAGGGDTQLTSYDVTIPANALAKAGDAIVVEGLWLHDGSAGTRTCKISVGSGSLCQMSANPLANGLVAFRMVIRRRTSTSGSVTGLSYTGSSTHGGAVNLILTNSAFGSVDWTTSQTLKIWAAHSTANACKLTDYRATFVIGLEGAVV